MSAPTATDLDYTREIPFNVPIERVFDALTTLDGLARWWTPIVSGNPAEGGEITFAFAGLDEKIVMQVQQAKRASSVIWSCLTHTGHPEWEGTRIVFELRKREDASGVLKFRHVGLIPRLTCYETCESGWEHFLMSLLDHAEHGKGRPF
jgi:uncharacterized protein YndB with AHSA1/START domain